MILKRKQTEFYLFFSPENVPRLFDLINVKNKDILPAFYFALKDTLVAKDLDQATRVGLQGATRYRVVTLKGELIDLSGRINYFLLLPKYCSFLFSSLIQVLLFCHYLFL